MIWMINHLARVISTLSASRMTTRNPKSLSLLKISQRSIISKSLWLTLAWSILNHKIVAWFFLQTALKNTKNLFKVTTTMVMIATLRTRTKALWILHQKSTALELQITILCSRKLPLLATILKRASIKNSKILKLKSWDNLSASNKETKTMTMTSNFHNYRAWGLAFSNRLALSDSLPTACREKCRSIKKCARKSVLTRSSWSTMSFSTWFH